jgi:hypothetical protein
VLLTCALCLGFAHRTTSLPRARGRVIPIRYQPSAPRL